MKEKNSENTELDVVGNWLLTGRQNGRAILYIFNLQVTPMIVGKNMNFSIERPALDYWPIEFI